MTIILDAAAEGTGTCDLATQAVEGVSGLPEQLDMTGDHLGVA